jgi:hypothetical protein
MRRLTGKSTVSVAMGLYNAQSTIEAVVQGLRWQTSLPDEVVIFDAGSNDESRVLLDALSEVTSFPISVHDSDCRQGIQGALVQAIHACSSDILVIIDQAQLLHPMAIGLCIRGLASDPRSTLVAGDLIITHADWSAVGYTSWEEAGIGRQLPRSMPKPQLKTILRHDLQSRSAIVVPSRVARCAAETWDPNDAGLSLTAWIALFAAATGFSVLPESHLAWRRLLDRRIMALGGGATSRQRIGMQSVQRARAGVMTARAASMVRLSLHVEDVSGESTKSSVSQLRRFAAHLLVRSSLADPGVDGAQAVLAEFFAGRYSYEPFPTGSMIADLMRSVRSRS